MEAEVILDSMRAEEDDSLSCHHQDEAVQGLQRGNNDKMITIAFILCVAHWKGLIPHPAKVNKHFYQRKIHSYTQRHQFFK